MPSTNTIEVSVKKPFEYIFEHVINDSFHTVLLRSNLTTENKSSRKYSFSLINVSIPSKYLVSEDPSNDSIDDNYRRYNSFSSSYFKLRRLSRINFGCK